MAKCDDDQEEENVTTACLHGVLHNLIKIMSMTRSTTRRDPQMKLRNAAACDLLELSSARPREG